MAQCCSLISGRQGHGGGHLDRRGTGVRPRSHHSCSFRHLFMVFGASIQCQPSQPHPRGMTLEARSSPTSPRRRPQSRCASYLAPRPSCGCVALSPLNRVRSPNLMHHPLPTRRTASPYSGPLRRPMKPRRRRRVVALPPLLLLASERIKKWIEPLDLLFEVKVTKGFSVLLFHSFPASIDSGLN
jgi:hypothetical protein